MKETERLDKILANMGLGTRSEVKKAVKQGRVTVNGNVVKDSGRHIDPGTDFIVFDEEPVQYRKYVYLMMHKPQGVISATMDVQERTVLDLLDPQYAAFSLFPAGRLDKDTEGLLLLTNDGDLAHRLLSPRKHVDKTYYVELDGSVDREAAEQFRQGVALDGGYKTKPAELVLLPIDASGREPSGNTGAFAEKSEETRESRKVLVTLTEGKYHQVKRMFQAVGREVIYLKRLSMGSLQLDESIPAGGYRELTAEEIRLLSDDR